MLPSNRHNNAVFLALVVTLGLGLIYSPVFILFQVVIGYMVIAFTYGLSRELIARAKEKPKFRRTRKPRPRRESPPSSENRPTWQQDWMALCASPAEQAFLAAAIDAFHLQPDDDALVGEIRLSLQERISAMRVDFCVNDNLAVEIDGAAYHSTRRAMSRDEKRDQALKNLGYSVLRIPASEVFSRPTQVIDKVRVKVGISSIDSR